MPSIGAVSALIVAERVDEAIRTIFDKKTRKDAYRFLNLSSRGGDRTYIVIASVLGTFFTIVAFFATNIDGLTAAVTVAIISLSALYLAVRRRKKAREELDTLIASDKEYWLPIADKLKKIVLDAGKFNDGLYPTQATRTVQ